MVYNLTNITTQSTVTKIFVGANVFSEGWFGIGSILSIFFVTWAMLGWFRNRQAFAAASFLTGIEGIIFIGLGLIHGRIALLIWVGFAIAGLFLVKGEE